MLKSKKKIIIFLILFLLVTIFFNISFNLINNTSGFSQKIKYFVPQKVRDILRETFYKNSYLKIENNQLNKKLNKFLENDLSINKKIFKLISTTEIISENNKMFSLTKYDYPFYDHFFWGKKPPGYIAEYKDSIFVMSGSGKIFYFKKNNIKKNHINFNILDSNFYDFVNLDNYLKKSLYGIRDITFVNNELFVSYVDKNSCDKLSILRGKLDLEFIIFKKFFSFEGCPSDFNGQDNEGLDNQNKGTFISQRSGGRIVKFDNENILFSIGDYGLTLDPPEAQNLDSLYGSVVKINLNTDETSLIAKGLRNPQGMFYDDLERILFITDHGPDGGDEINTFFFDNETFNNFGWPKSSYGKHYKSTINKAKSNGNLDSLIRGAPLNDSHRDFNFKEPLKYWTPSIGISEVIKINNLENDKYRNDIFIAAMGGVISEGDLTLHHLNLSENYNKVLSHDKIIINDRIRDIYYDYNLNKFVMILGNVPSIGFLEFID